MDRNDPVGTVATICDHQESPVLSTAQLAQRWNLPVRKIRRWCTQGAFPGAWRQGNNWVIPTASVIAREQGKELEELQNTA